MIPGNPISLALEPLRGHMQWKAQCHAQRRAARLHEEMRLHSLGKGFDIDKVAPYPVGGPKTRRWYREQLEKYEYVARICEPVQWPMSLYTPGQPFAMSPQSRRSAECEEFLQMHEAGVRIDKFTASMVARALTHGGGREAVRAEVQRCADEWKRFSIKVWTDRDHWTYDITRIDTVSLYGKEFYQFRVKEGVEWCKSY